MQPLRGLPYQNNMGADCTSQMVKLKLLNCYILGTFMTINLKISRTITVMQRIFLFKHYKSENSHPEIDIFFRPHTTLGYK